MPESKNKLILHPSAVEKQRFWTKCPIIFIMGVAALLIGCLEQKNEFMPPEADIANSSLPAYVVGPIEQGKPFVVTHAETISLLQDLMKATDNELAPDGSNLPEYVRFALNALTVRDHVPDIATADPLVTVATSFLHDIGGGGLPGEVAGPQRAREILKQVGRSPELIDRVCAIVGNHHLSKPLPRGRNYPELWIIVGCDVHSTVPFKDVDELLKIITERVVAAIVRANLQ